MSDLMVVLAWIRRMMVVVVLLAVTACASGGGAMGTATPITDLSSVAGRWDGLVRSPGDRDDLLELALSTDGTYRFTGTRMIGGLDASGRVDVQNGRLRFTGEGVTGTGSLYDKDGKRTLQFDLMSAKGQNFSGRFTPKP
jgi:hypothetical protein